MAMPGIVALRNERNFEPRKHTKCEPRFHVYSRGARNITCNCKRSNQAMLAMKAIKSARSLSFLMPANTILVPGIYFFGLIKYSNKCLSDQMIPEFLFASEYAKPSTVPD